MTILGVVIGTLVFLATLAGAIKALPVLWKFACLPGRIEERFEQLDKLDKLDGIETAVKKADANAQRAASIAEAAHDEWKGATRVVTREMARVANQVGRSQQQLDDHARQIEQHGEHLKTVDKKQDDLLAAVAALADLKDLMRGEGR